MNKFWETRLRHLWLLVSVTSLLLPLTSFLDNNNQGLEFSNVMTGVLAILFVASAPFSIFSLPLIALFKYGIELDLNSMFGAYFFIVILNIFGYLQWFWLVPKLLNRGKEFRLPTILSN